MPTRRVRKSRRSRKRKGGILGIAALKTNQDNINNCVKYWGIDRGICTTNSPIINYPSSRNIFPSYKPGTNRAGQSIMDPNEYSK